jgi:hypothetical protein
MKKQRADFEKGLIGDLITIEGYYHADHRWFWKKAGLLNQHSNGYMAV